LSWREVLALAPLTVFIVWIGVQPRYFLDRAQPTLNRVAMVVEDSLLERMRSDERMAQRAARDESFVEIVPSVDAQRDALTASEPLREKVTRVGD
jgi:NADH-quinone oxidoreductase subunit M